ncbi:MAG TPA: Sec-independent protein translocase protein TatB [Casimicrobiaceae bacterium]|nr:Sec-independent protein translocase protein TatB [Casimicrobiaceae bacterium]
MFDIGFSEIVVIAVVALIVIGPERLPRAARTAGHLFGRLQRYVNEVKSDINREMELDELRKLQQQVQSAARDIETSVSSVARDFEDSTRSIENDLNRAGEADASTTIAPPPLAEPPSEELATESSASRRQANLPGFEKI